jgi:hypothetical protein
VTGWLCFEGRIGTLDRGRATYTILPVPAEIVAELEAAGARRVEGEIAEHPVNLALTRAPAVEGAFLWTGRSLLDRIGVAPGAEVEVRLRPARDDAVDLPEDLAAALRAAGATSPWEALSPGKRRAHLYGVDSARRPATRARRVAALAAALGGGAR